jgi:copper chaperone CopZ
METRFNITGMHCQSCVAKVKGALTPFAQTVTVQLDAPQVIIESPMPISLTKMNAALKTVGEYQASPAKRATQAPELAPIVSVPVSPDSWFKTYQPLLIIAFFITIGSAITAWRDVVVVTQSQPLLPAFAGLWMSDFMAGFFLVFGFFKVLDVPAFARAYAGYDLIARQIPAWGYVYPFVEIALGVAYLSRWNPTLTNWITVVVMGTAMIGVASSLLKKRKIQCACLGTVFKLPMSTVTLIEDGLMIGMAAVMLIA